MRAQPADNHSTRPSESLMTAAQVAKRLSVSQAWVYQAVVDGRLPYRRLGRDDGPVRFVSAELDEWLETQRRGWSPGRHR
jgi:excisionase family DNA binding protein